jgi:LacI family transcriptional regulator
VLGVDDDEVICDLADPPLSSIEPDSRRIGFEGAMALASLMAGESLPTRHVLIPPVRVCRRRSTDVYAIDDPQLVKAMQFIREHGCDEINVGDVCHSVSLSRATLERRFREYVGRSPREEIERIRMERARLLLVETNYNLEHIAQEIGYRSAAHLVTVFRRLVGSTPGDYRKRFARSR